MESTNRFRKNLDKKVLAALIKCRVEDGLSWKETLKKTGLSHSKAELAVMEHEYFGAEGTVMDLTEDNVKAARLFFKWGWGPIMVMTQSSEAACRKTWKEGTGTHSDGTRVGHGGRFKFDEPELYVGELKPTGVNIPKDQPLVREVARDAAITTRLMNTPVKELRAQYEEATGKKPSSKWTPAKIAIELRKLETVNA